MNKDQAQNFINLCIDEGYYDPSHFEFETMTDEELIEFAELELNRVIGGE